MKCGNEQPQCTNCKTCDKQCNDVGLLKKSRHIDDGAKVSLLWYCLNFSITNTLCLSQTPRITGLRNENCRPQALDAPYVMSYSTYVAATIRVRIAARRDSG